MPSVSSAQPTDVINMLININNNHNNGLSVSSKPPPAGGECYRTADLDLQYCRNLAKVSQTSVENRCWAHLLIHAFTQAKCSLFVTCGSALLREYGKVTRVKVGRPHVLHLTGSWLRHHERTWKCCNVSCIKVKMATSDREVLQLRQCSHMRHEACLILQIYKICWHNRASHAYHLQAAAVCLSQQHGICGVVQIRGGRTLPQ